MHSAFRFLILIVAAAFISGPATAQGVKQIQLTEKQIQSFLAAQKEISKLTEKIQDGPNAKPDPKVEAAVQAATTKNGFSSFAEYSDVVDNISMIMSTLDPKTKAFSEPKIAIQKEIDEVKADKGIPEDQKKQQLAELNEALKTAEPVKFPSNIKLVKKHYDEIDAAMQ